MSAKYEFSRNMRKPVVSVQWLKDSAKAKKLAPMDRYKVLPLTGCVVSLTGYTSLQIRKKIEESVSRIGGIFMGDLVEKKTTHLIAASKDSLKYKHAKEIGKVSLVGVGMRSHAGIASTAFKALADAGINIQMISTSEIKITIVIAQTQLEKAVRILHKAFNLGG